MAIPLQILPLSHFTSLDFFLTSHLETPVGPLLRGREATTMMMKTSILPQVVQSAARSVHPFLFYSSHQGHTLTISSPLRSFSGAFSASPLSAPRVRPRSARLSYVFDQRCEMGSMIHSSLSSSSYLRLRNLLAQPEIILGLEMVARPLARIFVPKVQDLFLFYHSLDGRPPCPGLTISIKGEGDLQFEPRTRASGWIDKWGKRLSAVPLSS